MSSFSNQILGIWAVYHIQQQTVPVGLQTFNTELRASTKSCDFYAEKLIFFNSTVMYNTHSFNRKMYKLQNL